MKKRLLFVAALLAAGTLLAGCASYDESVPDCVWA